MATLIPAFGVCRFATSGERRLAQRLEEKLEEDYLLWYDVPIGQANSHPDFVILHPRRGVLILEVKDWKLDSIKGGDKQSFELLTNNGIKRVANPLEQARQYAHAVANALQKDPQLTFATGSHAGRLKFPWAYGVVFTNISRKQIEGTDLDQVIEPHRIICQDEMLELIDAEAFQQRLWGMFTLKFHGALSLPQRWPRLVGQNVSCFK